MIWRGFWRLGGALFCMIVTLLVLGAVGALFGQLGIVVLAAIFFVIALCACVGLIE